MAEHRFTLADTGQGEKDRLTPDRLRALATEYEREHDQLVEQFTEALKESGKTYPGFLRKIAAEMEAEEAGAVRDWFTREMGKGE